MIVDKEFLEESASYDFWDELPAEVKQAINVAKAVLDRGEGIAHNEVIVEMKNRFLKS
jgi:hypothetical protein